MILKLVDMPFHVGRRRGWGGVREFMNNADGPEFLERELVGLGGHPIPPAHKVPDTTPDHVRRQHETAYQLVLKSRQFPGINIR